MSDNEVCITGVSDFKTRGITLRCIFLPSSEGCLQKRRSHEDLGTSLFYDWTCSLAELARAVADDDVVDFGLVTVFLVEALLGVSDELAVEVVAHQVDGAAAEAAAHDA